MESHEKETMTQLEQQPKKQSALTPDYMAHREREDALKAVRSKLPFLQEWPKLTQEKTK